MESVLTILTSLTLSGALTALLLFLTKNWISERLKQSIEHEYAQKLESYKHVLRAEHEVAIERLRASNAQDQAIQSAATASFAEGHRAAHERRLAAIDVAWKAVLKLRANMPPAVIMLDIFSPESYDQFFTNPDFRKLLDSLSLETLNDILLKEGNEVEIARPFLSEEISSLWFAYRSLVARILILVTLGRKEGKLKPWYQAGDIPKLLSEIMSKQEFEQFTQMTVGHFDPASIRRTPLYPAMRLDSTATGVW